MPAELLNRYPNFSQIFTDGSKFEKNVGYAFKMDNSSDHFKLSSITSIFNAELKAIELALF